MADPQSTVSLDERRAEFEEAQRLATRYRLEFVDMERFPIDQELFRTIPADLMLRYSFVPYKRQGKTLVIVVPDPSQLPMLDEISQLLGTPIGPCRSPVSGLAPDKVGKMREALAAAGLM